MTSTRNTPFDKLCGVLRRHDDIDGDIIGENLAAILARFPSEPARKDLTLSYKWHKNKASNICTLDGIPLLFVKEMWQPEFLREILGIHVGLHHLDKAMSFQDYLFSKWTPPGRNPIPVLITTYINGKTIEKKQFKSFYKDFGRQYAYHEILALYDVDWRHFIVNGDRLARIDLGCSFSNLTKKYSGFWDMKEKQLKASPEFQAGRDEELALIMRNIEASKVDFNILLDALVEIGTMQNFFIDFNVRNFLLNLEKYWKTYSPVNVLGIIGRDSMIAR